VVTILRGNDIEEKISSEDLVPGDLVVIPTSGCELNFDGVLVSGTAIGY
jgi:cation transport ATPase